MAPGATIEMRVVAASHDRLPLPVAAAAARIVVQAGRIVAVGIEGLLPARCGEPAVHVCLMPRVRAGAAERARGGGSGLLALVIAAQVEQAGDGGLYVLTRGGSARTAVRSLWALGGARAVFGEAQRRFGLPASWYAVRMSPEAVEASVAARRWADELLRAAMLGRLASLASRPTGGAAAM